MATVTVCIDFGTQENKISQFPLFPHLFAMKWCGHLSISSTVITSHICVICVLRQFKLYLHDLGVYITVCRLSSPCCVLAFWDYSSSRSGILSWWRLFGTWCRTMPFHGYVRKAPRKQLLSRFGLGLRGCWGSVLPEETSPRSPPPPGLSLHAHCGVAWGQELGITKWTKKHLIFPHGASSQRFLPLNAKEEWQLGHFTQPPLFVLKIK